MLNLDRALRINHNEKNVEDFPQVQCSHFDNCDMEFVIMQIEKCHHLTSDGGHCKMSFNVKSFVSSTFVPKDT